jgi:hypothetical protein
MYKLEFTLKQHTPIIHFQHDQDGATLRATEVKPKLDRFIMMKLGKEADTNLVKSNEIYEKGKDIAKNKGWLIDDKKGALDYKIRINNHATKKVIIAARLAKTQPELLNDKGYEVISPSPFFAQEKNFGKELFIRVDPESNTNKDYQFTNPTIADRQLACIDKIGLMTDEKIECLVLCYSLDLLTEINKLMDIFFLSENFGTRQSKGFGSFTIKKINNEPKTYNVSDELTKIFDIVYEKSGTFPLSSVFKEIQNDYKLLKAGKGSPEGYAKSRLFLFFADKYVRWEKRWIKQNLNPITPAGSRSPIFPGYNLKTITNPGTPIDINSTQNWIDAVVRDKKDYPQPVSFNYIRALLGLAEMFDFATSSYNKKIAVKVIVDDIDRFRSPILFKVIESKIYLVANDDVPASLLGTKNVTFKAFKKDNEKVILASEKALTNPPQIPSSFSLREFLDFCLWQDKTNPNKKDTDTNKITTYIRKK